MNSKWIALAVGIGLAACTAETGGSRASPSTPESRAAAGRAWFQSYCVSCHGAGGTGDGPVAPALATAPADLTRLAQQSGGAFDAARVAAFIDGRERVASHGPSDMPVWGRRLDDRLFEDLSDETRLGPGAIFLIVEYLRSIQVSPDPGP